MVYEPPKVTIQRVFADTLTDEDRSWLALAAEGSIDRAQIGTYTAGIESGRMGLWRINEAGLIALTRTNEVLWVEFLVGDNLGPFKGAILDFLRREAQHRRIECLPSRKGMTELLKRLGFKEVTVLMRLEPEVSA